MRHNIKSVVIALLFGLLLPAISFANMPVASDGGIQVGDPDGPYWFNLSGVMKIDERAYTGNTATTASGVGGLGTYLGGAFIRDAGITLEGGVGENYGYTMGLDFNAQSKEVKIDEFYLTYYGFGYLMPNFSFSVGQVNPGFCLNCADSSKWIPFMERNMGTTTFGPKQGLGVSANTYDVHYSATVAITQQPPSGESVKTVYGQPRKSPDLWQASGRFTYAPISQRGKVLQFGLSGHIQEYSNNGLQFRAVPEMRSNNSTTLLNTTTYYTANPAATGPTGQLMIAALNQTTLDADILGIYGPWSAELEYQEAFITRGKVNGVKQGGDLNFSGFHAQAEYILTGETRPLKPSNGTLAQIKPKCKSGAWAVSARYSFITLNDKDIAGGRAYNTTASVSWYANNNIRVIGEYVYSLQRRQFPTYLDKRHVGGLGARVQVVF